MSKIPIHRKMKTPEYYQNLDKGKNFLKYIINIYYN